MASNTKKLFSTYLQKEVDMEVVEINDTGIIKLVIPHTALMELVHNDEACVQNGVSYHCVDIPIGERMHYAVRCVMTDKNGRRVESIGESLAATLDGPIAKNYPYLMANKRAIDSATISFLGFDSKVYTDAQIAVMPTLAPASSLINDAAAGSDTEQTEKQDGDTTAPQAGTKAGPTGKKRGTTDAAKPAEAKQGEKVQKPASATPTAEANAGSQENNRDTADKQPEGTKDASSKPEQAEGKPVSTAPATETTSVAQENAQGAADVAKPGVTTNNNSAEPEQMGEKADPAVSTAGEGQGDAPSQADGIPEVQVISSENQQDAAQADAIDLTGALDFADEAGNDATEAAGTPPPFDQNSVSEGENQAPDEKTAGTGGTKDAEAPPEKPSTESSADSTPNSKAEPSGIAVNTDLGEFKDPSDPYSLIVKYGKRKGYNWTISDLAEKDIESLKWLASFTARTPKAEETKRIAASWLSEHGDSAGNEGKNAA